MKIIWLSKITLVLSLTFLLVAKCSDYKKVIRKKTPIQVTAYFSGTGDEITNYDLSGVTQLIYSFLHLKGNRLTIDNPSDSLTLLKLSKLKIQYPKLKILASLGGWGGCKICSEAFSTSSGRKEFATSVAKILKTYSIDGLDMDWEYPSIEGYPNHKYQSSDKENFTLLMKNIRDAIGSSAILSFAAGGFTNFLEKSVDWKNVMPFVDYVNIMSYDLINGYSTITGHHTALYSNPKQVGSADYAVRYLDSIGVPKKKMIIGAAFYARVWEQVSDNNYGLYQSGIFKQGIDYKDMDSMTKDFHFFWDGKSKARYGYNHKKQLFITGDDSLSIVLKAQYAKKNHLGGIMFWELKCDKYRNGLLKIMTREAALK